MATESRAEALARLYDLDLAEDPGDLELYLALAARVDGPIVELAAGSGRLAVPLAAAAHQVVGVDHDPAMLARARTRVADAGGDVADRLRLVEADIVDVAAADLAEDQARGAPAAGSAAAPASSEAALSGSAVAPSGPRDGFALAILGLNSILLLADRERQRRVLATMASLLAPGGIAVVDCWLPAPEDLVRFDGRLSLEWLRVDPETGREVAKLAAAWYDGANRHVTLTTIFDEAAPGETPRRWTRTDGMRLVAADELAGHALDAGLVVEQLAGDYDLSPLGPGADRAVLVARRPGG